MALFLIFLKQSIATQLHVQSSVENMQPLHSQFRLQTLVDDDTESQLKNGEFVFNHLAKCGGSFAKLILRKSLNAFINENEQIGLSPQDIKNNSFIVGLIRNPFDYYVSLWAYTSDPDTCCFKNATQEAQQTELLGQQLPYGSAEADRKRFRNWLRVILSEKLGVESLRFYGSYLQQGAKEIPNFHRVHANAPNVIRKARLVNEALATFSASNSPISCWVRTESFTDDLRRCLVSYEAIMGQSSVNWAEFNATVKEKPSNPSSHISCNQLYDDATTKLVLQSDRHLLRAFDYPSHCHNERFV